MPHAEPSCSHATQPIKGSEGQTKTMSLPQVSRRSVGESPTSGEQFGRRLAVGRRGSGLCLSASSSAAGHMDGVTLVRQRPHRAACWLWECWRAGTDGTGASVENGLHCFHATQSPLISFLFSPPRPPFFFLILDSRLC